MANYRQIHTQIWRDNWFLDLEADEKLLLIYLFSNDNSNQAGIYELLGIGQVAQGRQQIGQRLFSGL